MRRLRPRMSRKCDHPHCEARSEPSRSTWKLWELPGLSVIQARADGWRCLRMVGLDFCPEHAPSWLADNPELELLD